MITTIRLDEYEWVERALSREQAAALAATTMVTVQPLWIAGTYRVTAGGTVGALRIRDDLEVRVRPRLPVRRVVYLLAHAAGLATWDDRLLELDEHAEVDVALANAFTFAAEQALRRGPTSSYYGVEDDLTEVRGRVRTAEQVRRFGLPVPISVAFDEYGVDNPENQALLGAALRLQRLANAPSALRRRLRRVAVALDGVRPATHPPVAHSIRFNRLNEHYRPAVALAIAVLAQQSFELGTGHHKVLGFTVNMWQLFEDFLTATLSEALERRHGGQLHPQRREPLDATNSIEIRPDLTWIVDNRPASVIDAKYKATSGGRPSDDNLYQAISYAAILGIRTAHLVHGAEPKPSRTIRAGESALEVQVSGLNLNADLSDLRDQLDRLADQIAAAVRDDAQVVENV